MQFLQIQPDLGEENWEPISHLSSMILKSSSSGEEIIKNRLRRRGLGLPGACCKPGGFMPITKLGPSNIDEKSVKHMGLSLRVQYPMAQPSYHDIIYGFRTNLMHSSAWL